MDKVVITRNQAERIQEWKYREALLLRFHAQNKLSDDNCLRSLTLDELARCLYGEGYEVEEKFEVGDKVFYRTMDTGMHTIIDMQAGICNLRGSVKLTNVETSNIRHATESEIAEEEKRRTNKKIDEILIGLSEYETDMLYERFECGRFTDDR